MTYPGNATLTQEMQERILSTFRQTLTAAAAGNRQEAKLGCDFILRLDSLFAPARELLERMEAGEGPVPTADLAAAVGLEVDAAPQAPAAEAAPQPTVAPSTATATATATAQAPDIDDLSDLDLEMGLSDPAAAPELAAEPAATPIAPPPQKPPAAPSPASPSAALPSGGDELDDIDLELSGEPAAEPAAAAKTAPAPKPSPAAESPPASKPPTAPKTTAAPEPSPAADPAPAPEPPTAPKTTAAPEPPPAADPAPAPEPPAAAEMSSAAEAEEPAAGTGVGGLEELDDLDLSAGVAEASAADAAPTPAPASEDAAEPAQQEAPAPPPAPESVEIPLGAEPSAQLDTESQQRIDDLLAEGQEAFDSGEYQGAIDAWSRIFLIDIDHAEANSRIEEARKLKAEADRKVEEKFHEGLAQLESGETEAAAATFRTVIEMQPSHLAARDYLEKLEAGEVPVPVERPRLGDADSADSLDDPDHDLADEMGETPKDRPDRGTKAVGESMVSVKKSPLKSRGFLAVAAIGLIAVLGGGWYLFQNWSSLFPNSAQEEPPPAVTDPVVRAQALHDEGKASIAIAQLRRLPPDNPQYDEAQALIAQWELEQGPTDEGPGGPSPQELARREALIAEAGAAAERREFLLTSELLSKAAVMAPLKGPEVQLLARADEQLQELQNFITIFREGEWDMALRDLWLLRESDPDNRDVTRLLVDSYYNLGLRALQRKDLKVASARFEEALALTPDDPELLRLADFAKTYQNRSTDLLYRIYVKYHPFR